MISPDPNAVLHGIVNATRPLFASLKTKAEAEDFITRVGEALTEDAATRFGAKRRKKKVISRKQQELQRTKRDKPAEEVAAS